MSDAGPGGGAAEVVVDPEAVQEVIKVLDDSIDRVREQQVQPVAPTAFGPTSAAAELARHTALAREAVVETLGEIRTGLEIYRENVVAYRRDMTGTDELAASDVRPLETALSHIGKPIGRSRGGDGA